MGERIEPGNRLWAEHVDVVGFGRRWHVAVMFDLDSGRPVELSLDMTKASVSDMAFLMHDAAVVASYMLQTGLPLDTLAGRLARCCPEPGPHIPPAGERDADGRYPASPIGLLVEAAVQLARDAVLPPVEPQP